MLSENERTGKMEQTSINIRMDENLKREFEGLCNDFGLTITAVFTVLAKTIVRRKKIPFEISKKYLKC